MTAILHDIPPQNQCHGDYETADERWGNIKKIKWQKQVYRGIDK